MITSLLADPNKLNLLFSAFILVAGLVVYWFFTPVIFREHKFTKYAFEYWLSQWFGFLLIFIVLLSHAGKGWLLATVDLTSVFALGFFWVFLEGKDSQHRQVILNLVFIYALLVCWNLGFSVLADLDSGSARWLLRLRILPSEAFSATALGLMAVVFYLRYGTPAIPFGFITVGYILVQRPIYEGTFVTVGNTTNSPSDSWTYALGVGKLLWAVVFYVMYFLPAKTYEPVRLPNLGIRNNPKLLSFVRRALTFIGGIVLSLILSLASKVLSDFIEWFKAP